MAIYLSFRKSVFHREGSELAGIVNLWRRTRWERKKQLIETS